MGNFIVLFIIIVLLSGASYKLYKDKKNNVKCSGCPSCSVSATCPSAQQKTQK